MTPEPARLWRGSLAERVLTTLAAAAGPLTSSRVAALCTAARHGRGARADHVRGVLEDQERLGRVARVARPDGGAFPVLWSLTPAGRAVAREGGAR